MPSQSNRQYYKSRHLSSSEKHTAAKAIRDKTEMRWGVVMLYTRTHNTDPTRLSPLVLLRYESTKVIKHNIHVF